MNRRQILQNTAAALTATAATLAATQPATATSKPEATNAIGLEGFDHMSVNVRDMDAMVQWYRDVLGLELETQWRVDALDGKRLAYFKLNGHRVVELVHADANGTGLRPPETFGQHFGSTGFGHLCFATRDVDATMKALSALGVASFVEAQTYPLDGTVFERRVSFVKDPEGNVIEFGEPLRKRA